MRKAITPILKSFQIEIDSLSKRSKITEKAFLEIYQHLTKLPGKLKYFLSLRFFLSQLFKDPVPALEYVQTLQNRIKKESDLEIKNQTLSKNLFPQLKNHISIKYI